MQKLNANHCENHLKKFFFPDTRKTPFHFLPLEYRTKVAKQPEKSLLCAAELH